MLGGRKNRPYSYAALTWLNEIQKRLPFGSNGQVFHRIEHALSTGERSVKCNDGETQDVDGYCEIGNRKFVFQFNGCRYHKCPFNCETTTVDELRDEKDCRVRRRLLETDGVVLETMEECRWNSMKPKTPSQPHIVSRFFQRKNITESEILEAANSDEFYGILECDITCPPSVQDRFMKINFPPIFRHVEIDESMVLDKMLDKIKKSRNSRPGKKENFQKQLTLTFNATQYLLTTDLFKFYKKIGMKMSNVSMCLEYPKFAPLKQFVSMVTEKRIEATFEEKNAVSNDQRRAARTKQVCSWLKHV